MRKFLFVFIVFLILLILCLYAITSDFASSLIPGWHTTIFPSYYFISFIVIANFIFPTLMFWMISKRNKKLKIAVLILHMLLSTIIISTLKFPSLFISSNGYDINQSAIESTIKFLRFIFIAFVTEQIIFGIYLFLNSRKEISN